MSARRSKVLMFFPWNGIHPQEAFDGTFRAAAARHWELDSAETIRGDGGAARLHRSSLAASSVAELAALLDPDGIVVWQDALFPREVGAVFRGVRAGGSGAKCAVFVDCCAEGAVGGGVRVGRVKADPASIASIAARELLSSGRADFAYVPNREPMAWSAERGDAFARCMEIAGRRFHAFERSGTRGGDELGRWLASLPKPCGIFAANDAVGGQIVGACVKTGIAVPDDVSVIGVDDYSYFCESCRPTLSSIAPDLRSEGRVAVELLADLLSDQSPRRGRELLVPAFGAVQRASTRFARDRRVSSALEFIRLNACKENFSPREVVREMAVSRTLADRLFRSVAGRTILDEIHSVRLGRAKTLLAAGKSLDFTASECGYASCDDFRRVFRRRVGATARKWAAANRV